MLTSKVVICSGKLAKFLKEFICIRKMSLGDLVNNLLRRRKGATPPPAKEQQPRLAYKTRPELTEEQRQGVKAGLSTFILEYNFPGYDRGEVERRYYGITNQLLGSGELTALCQ